MTDEKTVISAKDARDGEISLRAPPGRTIFVVGLAEFVVFAMPVA